MNQSHEPYGTGLHNVRKNPFLKYGILIAAVCCVLAEIPYRSGHLSKMEHLVSDTFHILAGVRSWYSPHVTIVSIDEKTLETFNDDPLVFWGPYHARALSALRHYGAKAIGMDLIFAISPEAWLAKIGADQSDMSNQYDMGFREQLNAGRVILAGRVNWSSETGETLLLPAPEYMYSLPGGPASVGLVNLFQDRDGVVRSFLELPKEAEPPNTTFAALLAGLAGETDTGSGSGHIAYVGPPGTVPRVSFADLISPSPPPETAGLIRDRIIIITVEWAGINDFHATPYTNGPFAGKVIMGGGEIHANIIETLLTGNAPKDLPIPARLCWLASLAVAATFLSRRLGPRAGFGAVCGLSLASAGISYLFFLSHILAPLVNVVLAMTACYIGVLGFRLTREEKDRRHLQAVFSPYVSEKVLDTLINSPEKPSLGGQELRITILFSDIRNFTTLSEALRPGEVVEMLNSYLERVCQRITEKGGIVDKFIGDAVMAVFGAPLPLENHARLGVETAVEMREIAADFRTWLKERFPDRDIPAFNIGVGLHTGRALIGNIGSKQRMEYTAIGDTINIASRLEGMCKSLGWAIVASGDCLEAAGSGIIAGQKETITPRGRKGSLEVFEILGTQNENQTGDES